MRTIAFATLTVLAALACTVLSAFVWWERPHLTLTRENAHRFVAHTELLSNYPSDIGLVELREAASGKLLWRGAPEGEMTQVHSLAFQLGVNDPDPVVFSGRFRKAPAYRLEAGVIYAVRLCAPTRIPMCRSRTFAFDR